MTPLLALELCLPAPPVGVPPSVPARRRPAVVASRIRSHRLPAAQQRQPKRPLTAGAGASCGQRVRSADGTRHILIK